MASCSFSSPKHQACSCIIGSMSSLCRLHFSLHTSLYEVGAIRLRAAHFSSWQVSSLGRIQNTRGGISWGYLRSNGYRSMNLSADGVRISGGGTEEDGTRFPRFPPPFKTLTDRKLLVSKHCLVSYRKMGSYQKIVSPKSFWGSGKSPPCYRNNFPRSYFRAIAGNSGKSPRALTKQHFNRIIW